MQIYLLLELAMTFGTIFPIAVGVTFFIKNCTLQLVTLFLKTRTVIID